MVSFGLNLSWPFGILFLCELKCYISNEDLHHIVFASEPRFAAHNGTYMLLLSFMDLYMPRQVTGRRECLSTSFKQAGIPPLQCHFQDKKINKDSTRVFMASRVYEGRGGFHCREGFGHKTT
jgi:hypothetical protein